MANKSYISFSLIRPTTTYSDICTAMQVNIYHLSHPIKSVRNLRLGSLHTSKKNLNSYAIILLYSTCNLYVKFLHTSTLNEWSILAQVIVIQSTFKMKIKSDSIIYIHNNGSWACPLLRFRKCFSPANASFACCNSISRACILSGSSKSTTALAPSRSLIPPPTNFLSCSTSLCSRSFSSLSRIVAAGLLSQLFPLDLFLERDEANNGAGSTTPVIQTRYEQVVAVSVNQFLWIKMS